MCISLTNFLYFQSEKVNKKVAHIHFKEKFVLKIADLFSFTNGFDCGYHGKRF